MNMKLNKTFYRIFLIVSFIGVNALIVSGISAVLSYLNSGADRTSMLHLEVAMEEVYLPKMVWNGLENPGRPMEQQTLSELEKDYMSAWHVRNIAYMKNDPYGIEDFYTDSARVRLYEQIDLNKKGGNWFKSTTLAHHPELDFYSQDGTLVVLTDRDVEQYKEVYEKETLLYRQKDTLSYQVMLLLEDGFWRIRHLKALNEPVKLTSQKRFDSEIDMGFLNKIKGVNYYPQASPWDTFGKKFDSVNIENDFERIREMGLNTIRVFVQYEDFGKANVPFKKLLLLQKMLDLAAKNKLKVMVTLFDFYGDYDITNWTLTQRHAEAIVEAVKDHPALLAWDIKNEPDLDFDSRGRERVLSWLGMMLEKVKQWDPVHPVTVGWSSPEAGKELSAKVDFVSFHYYRKPEEFLQAYNQLRKAVPGKTLVLQEYGFSSYSGIWNAFRGGEEEQAVYYATMQASLEQNEIPFLFWGLHDFKKIPTSVVGRLPWRKERQKYFGVFTQHGTTKPAYSYLSVKE